MRWITDFFTQEITPFFLICQLIGFVGLSFAVFAFQCRSHTKIMIFRTLNELTFAVQYFLIGAYTGTAMNCVGSTRNLLFAALVAHKRSTLPFQILFSAFFLIFGIVTWQGPISAMVICAKVVTTVAFGIKNPKILRMLTLPTSCCWLFYNFYSQSLAGVLCELFTIVSILIAMIRLDFRKRPKPSAESGSTVEQSSDISA